MNYYEHHLGDYLRKTMDLSMGEDGAYHRLLEAYYIHERPLPGSPKECQKLARATKKSERDSVSKVLSRFFKLGEDGLYHQDRADREIARFQDKQRKAKASADARWSKSERDHDSRGESDANAYANASPDSMRTHSAGDANGMHRAPVPSNQSPVTSPQEERDKRPMVAPARPSAEAAGSIVSSKVPECPHLELLALWAEILPSLPRHMPALWRGARAAHLRARWREAAVEKGWQSRDEGLVFFRKVFIHVSRSPFLVGQAPPRRPGAPAFVCELEWLVRPENWAKTLEGKYHQDVA